MHREHLALVKDMRKSIKDARKAVREGAKLLKCPLSGVQMKKIARAADGHYYDLTALKAHLRDHMDKRVRSPITGRSMVCVLYRVESKKRVTWSPF